MILCCCYFTFIVCPQFSPWLPEECFFFTNKLSVPRIYWPCITLPSLYLAFVCFVYSFYVSLFVIWLVYFFYNLCCLNCWLHVWLIGLWLLTLFTKLSSIHFMFRYSEIMIIPALFIVYLHFLQSLVTCGSGRFFPVHTRVFLCWHKVLIFASELIFLSWM
jgi:hypothetical protein